MLHVLALTYFVTLLSVAGIVMAGTLRANRDVVMRALGLCETPVALLPPPSARQPGRARVIRIASPAPVLRLAA